MKPGIVPYKKMSLCLLVLLLFSGNYLLAQKVDATPDVIALLNTNTDSSKVNREFSPNGDGNSDTFSFQPINMVSMNVVVFDKDRNIIYKSDKLDVKWDGYDLKKQKAKAGIYYFIQKALGIDGKNYEQRGCIKLTR